MRKATTAALAAALVLAFAATPAFATNGYFAHGYGTHYKGMAGAGAALHLNSLAPATNPAAMAFLGPRWDASLSLFNPNRSYTVTGNPSGFPGTFGLTPGTVESDSRYFPVPAFGGNWNAGENGAFGLALYGNGGMNTDWPTNTFYAGTPTGINLSQMFVAPTYAIKLADKHGLGVTAIGAVQWFKAEGIGSFAPFSSAPSKLSGNGNSYSYGAGLRVGYLGEWSKYFSFGASYQTKVWMSQFDEYSGLFAEQGGFDIPANWVAGIAVKPTENVDIAVDVQQVLYSGVASVANPLLPNLGACGQVTGPLPGHEPGLRFRLGGRDHDQGRPPAAGGRGLDLARRLLLQQPADPRQRGPVQHPGPGRRGAAPDLRLLQDDQQDAGDQLRGHAGLLARGEGAQPPRGAGPADDRAEDGPVGLRAQLVLRDQQVGTPAPGRRTS